MTVQDTSSVINYLYTGAGDYSYPFKAYLNSDIIVEYISTSGVSTILTEGGSEDYTLLRDNDDVGGTVTSSYAATDGTLRIFRSLPLAQNVALENQGPLDMNALEKALDRNIMILQQIQADVEGVTTVSEWRGAWVTGTAYSIRDIVQGTDGNWYVCLADHTAAASFATDLATGYWLVVIDVSSVTDLKTVTDEDGSVSVTYGATTISLKIPTSGVVTDKINNLAVTTGKIDNLAVTTGKINDLAVTTGKIAAGAVTGAKISDAANIVHNDIIGGDVTKTAATTLSITACRCWDSTRLVLLETTEVETVTDPTGSSWAANTTYHIYQVRVISGSTIEFRAYATEGGAAADTAINAYRWRSFWRTDGSGNLYSGVLVKDRIAFTIANYLGLICGSASATGNGSENAVTTTVDVDISSMVPLAHCKSVTVGYSIYGSSGPSSGYGGVVILNEINGGIMAGLTSIRITAQSYYSSTTVMTGIIKYIDLIL